MFLEEYKINNGYQYIFSYAELNSDTSLVMAFSITLEFYHETRTHELLDEGFTYNASMDISGIDNPQYLYYSIK